MGNKNNDINSYYMHIQLIGEKMSFFLKLISGKEEPSKAKTEKKERKKIEDFWDFDYSVDKEIKDQIEEYFKILFENKEKKTEERKELKECLIVRVANSSDPIIDIIFENLNKLRFEYLMPIVLFLTNEKGKEINPDNKKYKYVQSNLIVSKLYSEDEIHFKDEGIIKKLLLRFCSIYNELGDSFSIGEDDKDIITYDLNKNYFPFNLNICCIGRFGQGKSTGVNILMGEYKAKESSKLISQTKNITFYQHSNYPLRIIDIPGFDSKDNVQKTVEKIEFCNKEMNKLKDRIHCYLYFLNFSNRGFTDFEAPIFEKIIKIKEAKIIYVITHSPPNLEEDDIEEYINNFNESINKLSQNKIFNDNQKKELKIILEASKKNVVFVNFRKNIKNNYNIFGIEDLFERIKCFFHESENYKKSLEKLTEERIKEQALKLKEQAKKVVLWNKIGGGIVGIIPGLDWVLQRFVIKENAVKKIGMIFGVNFDSLIKEEKKQKIKEEKEKQKYEVNLSNIDIEYDENALDLEIDKSNLVNDSYSYKIGNSCKIGFDISSTVGGAISVGIGFSSNIITVTEAGVTIGSIAARTIGFVFLGLSIAIGVSSGAYFTTKHINEIIEKLYNYYLNNADKISNSYKLVDEYLILRAQKKPVNGSVVENQ